MFKPSWHWITQVGEYLSVVILCGCTNFCIVMEGNPFSKWDFRAFSFENNKNQNLFINWYGRLIDYTVLKWTLKRTAVVSDMFSISEFWNVETEQRIFTNSTFMLWNLKFEDTSVQIWAWSALCVSESNIYSCLLFLN